MIFLLDSMVKFYLIYLLLLNFPSSINHKLPSSIDTLHQCLFFIFLTHQHKFEIHNLTILSTIKIFVKFFISFHCLSLTNKCTILTISKISVKHSTYLDYLTIKLIWYNSMQVFLKIGVYGGSYLKIMLMIIFFRVDH